MVNLFDLWIVLAVCFLLAALGAASRSTSAQAPKTFEQLPRHRETNDALSGAGERLGVAYRLNTGEVVYVPEAKKSN